MENTEAAQIPDLANQDVQPHEVAQGKTPQESFAELRKAKEDLERQLWQAKQEKDFFEKQMALQRQPPKAVEEDFDYRQLENEEFPDGKRLVKALDTLDKKLNGYEKKLAEKDQKIQILEAMSEFPDFRQVVTLENIEKYIKSDEDNREAIDNAKDPLRKAYRLIKKSAAYQSDVGKQEPPKSQVKQVSQEQQRVDEKEGRPKIGSLTHGGVTSSAITAGAQLSNSKMSRSQKEAIWRETQAAARR